LILRHADSFVPPLSKRDPLMPRLIRCACGQSLQVPADTPGKQIRCPTCGRTFTVAPPSGDAAAIRATPPPATASPREALAASPAIRMPADLAPRERPPSRFGLPQRAALPAALAGALLVLVLMCGGGAGLFVLMTAWRSPAPRFVEHPPTALPQAAPPVPAPVAPADPVAVVVPVYDRPDWFPAPGPEQEARRQARRAWLKQTCRDAYDRCGRKDPRWDAAAHEALAAFEAFHCRVPAGGEEQRPAGLAARRAIDAGCDDPLIQYVALLLSSGVGELPAAERGRLARGAVAGMERSTYPAIRRIQVLHARASGLLAGGPVAPDRAREARRLLDACCTLLADAVRDLQAPARDETGDLCEDLIETYHALDNDRQIGYRKVADALAKGRAPEAFRLWVEGTFDTTYAWDARGDGWADTVTEEGWRGFHDRLGQARAALERRLLHFAGGRGARPASAGPRRDLPRARQRPADRLPGGLKVRAGSLAGTCQGPGEPAMAA
jgi:hypothetical protein